MITLTLHKIIDFYDVPQLLIAKDMSGRSYLCLLYDINDEGNGLFTGVRISERKLSNLSNRSISLLDAVREPEFEIYDLVSDDNFETLSGNFIADDYTIPEDRLPDENYIFPEGSTCIKQERGIPIKRHPQGQWQSGCTRRRPQRGCQQRQWLCRFARRQPQQSKQKTKKK